MGVSTYGFLVTTPTAQVLPLIVILFYHPPHMLMAVGEGNKSLDGLLSVIWMIGNGLKKYKKCWIFLETCAILNLNDSHLRHSIQILLSNLGAYYIISRCTATSDPFYLICLIRAQHTWRSVACGRTQRSLSRSVTPWLLLSTLKVSQSCSPALVRNAYYCLPASRVGISATTLRPYGIAGTGFRRKNAKGCTRRPKLESWETE